MKLAQYRNTVIGVGDVMYSSYNNNHLPSVLENHTIISNEKCVPSGAWLTGNENCQELVARVGGYQQ